LPFSIVEDASPNSPGFETSALIKASGFREYDARWWFGHPGSDRAPDLNLIGVQALGMGLGTLMRRLGAGPDIVVGHDFRAYSLSIKLALVAGLMAAGARVRDIGLALSPMAYFAQFALDVSSVAMVTASHNENGWTGVKMGVERPLTFGPEEMSALRGIVLSGDFEPRPGGGYEFVDGMARAYLDDLAGGIRLSRKLKVVAACGNGTAGAFAPEALERIGCEVVPLDTALDHRFPRYNPNPEDMAMLHAIRAHVLETGADLGLGFDGDGDRCGVVDDEGREIFADKVGVLLARDLSALNPGARFVVDVKSTGLYASDPVLRQSGAVTDYWKTGHSYIKRRVAELGAIAGFEKSGHFFFGSDDGRPLPLAAGDLGHADHVAALRGRPQVPGGRACARRAGDAAAGGQAVRGPRDRRPRHGERRARGRAGRHLGAGARLLQQARARGRGRKPGVAGEMFSAVDALLRQHPEVGRYNQTF
jgi:phosphomannomutase/phosphoglucomutase